MTNQMEGISTPIHDKFVNPVPRFFSCIKALKSLFEPDLPPVIITRSAKLTVLIYGFVDASGSRFGSTLQINNEINYRIGTWSSQEEKKSTNWREFENLVSSMEESGNEGLLSGATILSATDNSIVEASMYKGNSRSKELFSLVVWLKKVEITHS